MNQISTIGTNASSNFEIREKMDEPFFKKLQKSLNWFVFFLPIGVVKIGGISITFFIFLVIISKFRNRGLKIFEIGTFTDKLLLFFFAISFFSLLVAEDTFRERALIADMKLLVRYFYWMVLALFIKTWVFKFDIYKLSKYYFYGFLTTIVFFYMINPYFGVMTQNGFAYTLVVSTPIVLFYTYTRHNFLVNVALSFILTLIALKSGSRSGALLVFMEAVILLGFAKPFVKKIVIFGILLALPFVGIAFSYKGRMQFETADLVRGYNPRLAELIEDPEQVNKRDKSWLIRRLMVQKGLTIAKEHPVFGVGLGRFRYYKADLFIFSKWLHRSNEYYNKKSAHNSYVLILAESGTIALIFFILIQIIIMLKGTRLLLGNKLQPKLFFFMSFVGMSLYFYTIASITGSITWFTIGLAMTIVQKRNIA